MANNGFQAFIKPSPVTISANHMEIELHSISPEAEMEFDDDEHEFEYRQQAAVLDVAVASVDEAKELHKAANAELKKANRELKKLEENTKNYGKVSQDLWMTIQRKLHKDYNVHISSYHGGDMEGNECRRLLRNAEIIMEDIKSILVAHLGQLPDDEKERRADQAEVELFCAGFTRLFQYMDLISHYCYQPYGSMSDADVENSEKAITLASELWLLLMPTIPMKIHAWQHLKEDLRQYKGMKSHNEQQIERTHQDGKKHDRRLWCFRDFEKKTNNILRHAATVDTAEVQAKLKETEDARLKRKRKIDLVHAEEAQQVERVEYLKSITQLPPFNTKFPGLLQLIKLYRRKQTEENGVEEGEEMTTASEHMV